MGVVRDRHTKQPMPNVRVAVDTGQEALTDEQGKFQILDIAPGDHLVTISGESLATVGTTETFEASKKIDATYEVDRKKGGAASGDEDEEIVVTAPRLKKQVVSTEVQATQAAKVPGTQGDVLKVVENLPGVARAAAGSSSLVVWGSAPQDTRVYVDGVHVPLLYHGGGYRSILPSNFVKSVELVPGGYGPSYGRGLGGLVTVAMRPLDDDGVHGSVSADVIDASADVRAKLSDRVHVALGFRKSYLDTVLANVTTEDVGDIVPIPRYWDGQARVVYEIAPHETIELGGLASSDRIANTLLNPDPSLTTRQTSGTDFQRIFLHYEKHMTDSSVITIVPSFGYNSITLANSYGSVVTDVDNESTIFGLRADWHGPVMAHVRGDVGLDVEMLASSIHRDGSIGAPPREGDVYVFGQPPPSEVGADDWKTVVGSLAPYAEADISLLDDDLHIVPGVRFEPFITSANKTIPSIVGEPNIGNTRQVAEVEPRISVHYAFTPQISGKAAFGVYHQAPQPEDLSAELRDADPRLSRARSTTSPGATFQLTPSLTGRDDGLSVAHAGTRRAQPGGEPAPGPRARSDGDRPLLRHAVPAAPAAGRPLLRLAQLQHPPERAQGRARAAVAPLRLRPVARLHGPRFVRSRQRIRGGAALPLRDRLSAHAGARRVLRRADQHVRAHLRRAQLDPHPAVRVARRARREALQVARIDGEIYLDVQNVTDHSNPEEIVYNTNYTQRGYITGLPILPVMGAKLEW